MTYEQALGLFRNMVNQKHPPQMGVTQNRVRRNVNEVSSSGRGRGQSNRGGHGRGGRGGGRGRSGRGQQRIRTDSRMITLTDGSQVEYHASFNFPRHIFLKMKQEDKDALRRERAAYNETQRNRTEIQELRSQIQDNGGAQVSTSTTSPTDVSVSQDHK